MYAYHICSLHTSQVALQVGAYPGFCSMKQLRVFLFPPPPFLDGMLVNRRVTPNIKFTGTHLYTWVEREKEALWKWKCLAQEQKAMSSARARTLTAWSGEKHTNHEATVPPHHICRAWYDVSYSVMVNWMKILNFVIHWSSFKHK